MNETQHISLEIPTDLTSHETDIIREAQSILENHERNKFTDQYWSRRNFKTTISRLETQILNYEFQIRELQDKAAKARFELIAFVEEHNTMATQPVDGDPLNPSVLN